MVTEVVKTDHHSKKIFHVLVIGMIPKFSTCFAQQHISDNCYPYCYTTPIVLNEVVLLNPTRYERKPALGSFQ